ncbi:Pyrimidine operon attenuation protein / uracil phosphoribosyltransferase [Tenacibaculum sediminilitoris]|uniref:phosphoribosyltransferase family protein n=1 Tax=Tenacibaculum sediminilitoris TaxID=1820334 RepID=UPI0038933692
MIDVNNIILNNVQIEQKIRRIAFQIYESNSDEKEIIIAGIADNGYFLAEKISTILSEISPIKITLCKVLIDKKNPITPTTTSINSDEYQNKALVLVDDVLNSGTTLIYGVKHFLEVPLKRFKTAVLVNRNHKKYPVKADFKGISLSTSIKEHIVVEFTPNETIAYLT